MLFLWKTLLLCSFTILSHNGAFARPFAAEAMQWGPIGKTSGKTSYTSSSRSTSEKMTHGPTGYTSYTGSSPEFTTWSTPNGNDGKWSTIANGVLSGSSGHGGHGHGGGALNAEQSHGHEGKPSYKSYSWSTSENTNHAPNGPWRTTGKSHDNGVSESSGSSGHGEGHGHGDAGNAEQSHGHEGKTSGKRSYTSYSQSMSDGMTYGPMVYTTYTESEPKVTQWGTPSGNDGKWNSHTVYEWSATSGHGGHGHGGGAGNAENSHGHEGRASSHSSFSHSTSDSMTHGPISNEEPSYTGSESEAIQWITSNGKNRQWNSHGNGVSESSGNSGHGGHGHDGAGNAEESHGHEGRASSQPSHSSSSMPDSMNHAPMGYYENSIYPQSSQEDAKLITSDVNEEQWKTNSHDYSAHGWRGSSDHVGGHENAESIGILSEEIEEFNLDGNAQNSHGHNGKDIGGIGGLLGGGKHKGHNLHHETKGGKGETSKKGGSDHTGGILNGAISEIISDNTIDAATSARDAIGSDFVDYLPFGGDSSSNILDAVHVQTEDGSENGNLGSITEHRGLDSGSIGYGIPVVGDLGGLDGPTGDVLSGIGNGAIGYPNGANEESGGLGALSSADMLTALTDSDALGAVASAGMLTEITDSDALGALTGGDVKYDIMGNTGIMGEETESLVGVVMVQDEDKPLGERTSLMDGVMGEKNVFSAVTTLSDPLEEITNTIGTDGLGRGIPDSMMDDTLVTLTDSLTGGVMKPDGLMEDITDAVMNAVMRENALKAVTDALPGGQLPEITDALPGGQLPEITDALQNTVMGPDGPLGGIAESVMGGSLGDLTNNFQSAITGSDILPTDALTGILENKLVKKLLTGDMLGGLGSDGALEGLGNLIAGDLIKGLGVDELGDLLTGETLTNALGLATGALDNCRIDVLNIDIKPMTDCLGFIVTIKAHVSAGGPTGFMANVDIKVDIYQDGSEWKFDHCQAIFDGVTMSGIGLEMGEAFIHTAGSIVCTAFDPAWAAGGALLAAAMSLASEGMLDGITGGDGLTGLTDSVTGLAGDALEMASGLSDTATNTITGLIPPGMIDAITGGDGLTGLTDIVTGLTGDALDMVNGLTDNAMDTLTALDAMQITEMLPVLGDASNNINEMPEMGNFDMESASQMFEQLDMDYDTEEAFDEAYEIENDRFDMNVLDSGSGVATSARDSDEYTTTVEDSGSDVATSARDFDEYTTTEVESGSDVASYAVDSDQYPTTEVESGSDFTSDARDSDQYTTTVEESGLDDVTHDGDFQKQSTEFDLNAVEDLATYSVVDLASASGETNGDDIEEVAQGDDSAVETANYNSVLEEYGITVVHGGEDSGVSVIETVSKGSESNFESVNVENSLDSLGNEESMGYGSNGDSLGGMSGGNGMEMWTVSGHDTQVWGAGYSGNQNSGEGEVQWTFSEGNMDSGNQKSGGNGMESVVSEGNMQGGGWNADHYRTQNSGISGREWVVSEGNIHGGEGNPDHYRKQNSGGGHHEEWTYTEDQSAANHGSNDWEKAKSGSYRKKGGSKKRGTWKG